MIRLANNEDRQQVWDMWKTCFGDPDNYMELYFRDKYRPENTLLYIEDARTAASLQMLHYRFTFHGIEIPVIYLSGVCTLPAYRQKGYTRALLLESFREAARREVPLILLVPQEEWLVKLYAKYGFVLAFDAGTEEELSLKELLNHHEGNLEAAYREFDHNYRVRDMTVQKTFDDFRTIVEEAALFDFPVKKSLPGMARVIDVEYLLTLFASRRSNKATFSVTVEDKLIERNNGTRVISGDKVIKNNSPEVPGIEVQIDDLTQLLLGYHTASVSGTTTSNTTALVSSSSATATSLASSYRSLFPEKTPSLHFMLE